MATQPAQPAPKPAQPHQPPKHTDPQDAKLEAHEHIKVPTVYTPEPSPDPRAHAPQGAYADGMDIATEQRARAAWVEAHGAPPDERPEAERPVYDPHALAGGGAFVSAGKQGKVPGVTPPTKRE
jgi:hypothetical protein